MSGKSFGKQYPCDAIEQCPDCEERQPDDKADNKRKHNTFRGYIESGRKYCPSLARYERIRIGKQINNLMIQICVESLKRLP